MKQHKITGLKNVVTQVAVQTAGGFYSTAHCLATGCEFARAPIQIHRVIPIHTGPYPHSQPVFVFQSNVSGSEKGGTRHRS